MGFYIQNDYWEAVSELDEETQDKVLGALVRLYFTGEEADLQGVARALYIASRERVKCARKHAVRRDANNEVATEVATDVATQTATDSATRTFCESSIKEGEGEGDIYALPNGNAKGGAKRTKPRFKRPTLSEVADYVSEIGASVEPQRFIDYYESNGWKVGRNPMKDWKATVRNWASKDKKEGRDGAKSEYAALW